MDTTGVIQLVSLLILVLLSAFFSSAETSFSTVNRVRLRTLASEDHKGAIRVLGILDQYGKMLSAILIGNKEIEEGTATVKLLEKKEQVSVPIGDLIEFLDEHLVEEEEHHHHHHGEEE